MARLPRQQRKEPARNEKIYRRRRGSTIDRSRVKAEAAAEGGAGAGVDAVVKREEDPNSWTRSDGIDRSWESGAEAAETR